MKRTLFIVFLLLPALLGWANETCIVEITPTKKIIHVDQLGMSDNAGVLDVLEMMPELLSRGTSFILSNFSIQIDNKDVGQARDVVLMQTRLAEVEKIEITTSPTSSEQLNGTGGVINIILKPVSKEGVSGSVLLDASTGWDVQPSVILNYRKNKFVLRSSLMMEYYRPTSYSQSTTTEPFSSTTQQDTSVQSFKQETAKLYMIYNFTERDQLKAHVWETFDMTASTMQSGLTTLTDVTAEYDSGLPLLRKTLYQKSTIANSRNLMAEANVEYTHQYRRGGKLEVEGSYNYSNKQYSSSAQQRPLFLIGGNTVFDTTITQAPHQLRGTIKSIHQLLPASSLHHLKLEWGANATYTFGQSSQYNMMAYGAPDEFDSSTDQRTLYASPYMQWDYTYDRWTVRLGARYQYYNVTTYIHQTHHYISSADSLHAANHCATANASVGCRVADGHHLRLLAARNIIRNGANIVPVHNAELNYIFDYQIPQHQVVTNFGLQYINTQMPAQTDHVLSVNAQVFYRHSFFSMAFAGNVYAKEETSPTDYAWGTYFNLSWTPIFSFRNQWTLSAKLLYNSAIKTWSADYGDCFFTQLRLSKDIGAWNLHVALSDILDYQSFDTIREGDRTTTQTYDLYQRSLLIGAAYKF